jgi:tRNA dimethylallyltransferase
MSDRSVFSLAANLKQCVFLAGPTGAGKSEAALHIAENVDGEVLSVDSMQVYRGMDIGTSKLCIDERRGIPHHLLDIVDVSAPFDAAEYVSRAEDVIEAILARRKTPILCGGTGLYFKVLLEGIGGAPPSDPVLRAELEARSLDQLVRELAEKDPATAAGIDAANPRRVIRALEVVLLTGKSFAAFKAPWLKNQDASAFKFFGIERPPEDLKSRIDQRVQWMFDQGLVEETRRLLERGLANNRTAMQAIGYRQVVEHLEGQRDLEKTIDLVKQKTRQYAKRQMTWFRRQLPIRWVPWNPQDTAPSIAQTICREL